MPFFFFYWRKKPSQTYRIKYINYYSFKVWFIINTLDNKKFLFFYCHTQYKIWYLNKLWSWYISRGSAKSYYGITRTLMINNIKKIIYFPFFLYLYIVIHPEWMNFMKNRNRIHILKIKFLWKRLVLFFLFY